MKLDEIKQTVLNNLKKEPINEAPAGGQSCGMPDPRVRIYSEDLNIAIECGYHRSKLKNCDMITKIFEKIIDEEVK
jgi:protein subunit release factor A